MWFSKNLRFLRQKAGLSQDELGEFVGKSFTTIQRWETGINEPNLETANILATRFGVDLTEMCKIDLSSADASRGVSSSWYYVIPADISAGELVECNPIGKFPRISVPDFIMGKYAHNQRIVFMHVNGDSMNRVIPDGSIITVETGIEKGSLHPGDPVVATNGREYTVKRYYDDPGRRRLILRPDSYDPRFTDIIIPYDTPEPFTIYGKVVIYPVYL